MTISTLVVFILFVISLGFTVYYTDQEGKEFAKNKPPLLHPLFSDHMVLQRDKPLTIWGWADSGEEITVTLDNQTATAVANRSGKWAATLGPFKAGGPFTLTANGPETITLQNVMVGEVWLCSGQSNMEMGMTMIDQPDAIAAANHLDIRLFLVPRRMPLEPLETVKSRWQVCTPESIAANGWGGFSAAAYFFGKELHERLQIPIGLIESAWGGTPAEAWTSRDALQKLPVTATAVKDFDHILNDQRKNSYEVTIEKWWKKNDPGSTAAWQNPAFNDSTWKTMKLPTAWEHAGLPDYDGVCWFRLAIDLPADWAGQDLMLHFPLVDDRDTTWFNGVKVGGLDLWHLPRDYKIPGRLVKARSNVIAVRVLDQGQLGGIYGEAEKLKLERLDGQGAPLSLAVSWRYQETIPLNELAPMPLDIMHDNPDNPEVGSSCYLLYNGMIAPLAPFGLRGVIWYQGESNGNRGYDYRSLLPAMIKDWRTLFKQGDFPFLIAQLTAFTDPPQQPCEDGWAEVREAQLLTAQNVPNAAMAVTIDIGDAKDIHPKNKWEVGRRLALLALAKVHSQDIVYSGPLYKGMKVEGNKIRLSFDFAQDGLTTNDHKPPKSFAISGKDKKWFWAETAIENDSVLVWSAQVTEPIAVRYAWAAGPACNLFNQAGLPVSPFRTDIPE